MMISTLGLYSFKYNTNDAKTSFASFYHDKFNGRKTASGEIFDNSKLTLRGGLEYLWLKPQVLSASENYDYSAEQKSQGVPPIPYLELRGEF